MEFCGLGWGWGMGGMVVVVAVVVVGIPVVGIMVVVGPSSASRWYALPLLLACMSYNCILFVCPALLQHTHTHTCFFLVCLAIASWLYVLQSSRTNSGPTLVSSLYVLITLISNKRVGWCLR